MSSLERSSESNEKNVENNVVDFSAHHKALLEVQESSAEDYQSRIKSMEQPSSKSHNCLPSFDISFGCLQQLTQAGIAVRELLSVGIPACELLAAGFTPSDLLAAGVYTNDLLAAGVSSFDLEMRQAS
jgi:hypothetical protein